MAKRDAHCGWLLLVYQFAAGPGSARVKVWRRLRAIGAVAIKNSVYVLPDNDQSQEDFAWLLQELRKDGADGAILECRFVDGMDDDGVRALFNDARHDDFVALREEAVAETSRLRAATRRDEDLDASATKTLRRLRKKLADVSAIDFFSAPGKEDTLRAIQDLEEATLARPMTVTSPAPHDDRNKHAMLRNRVWVTRAGVRVDRIASAWLIRNWLDPDASFKFVAPKGYQPRDGELRFDMFEAEYTHEGDLCTFEVLFRLADPDDPALQRIAEIVHDIDLKDGKFGHPETDGVSALLNGIAASCSDDESRLERGGQLFNDLYESFGAGGA